MSISKIKYQNKLKVGDLRSLMQDTEGHKQEA